MPSELNPIDLHNAPSLPELVDEVRRTNRARVIRADGKDVAVLVPASQTKPVKRQGKREFSPDDPLFSVIGIGRSGKPTDIATHKDEYLAEAYLSEMRPTKT